MTDATDKLAQTDFDSLEPREEIADPATRQRLLVVAPTPNRTLNKESRTVTSLANVFGKFAEMQQLVGDQVVALEDSVQQQGQQLAEVSGQLPDMKERINWLIASYYEEDCKSEALRQRITQQESGSATLGERIARQEAGSEALSERVSYQEIGTEALGERITRQGASMEKLTEAVRHLCDVQAQWKTTMDQLLQIFGRAQSLTLPSPPQFPQ